MASASASSLFSRTSPAPYAAPVAGGVMATWVSEVFISPPQALEDPLSTRLFTVLRPGERGRVRTPTPPIGVIVYSPLIASVDTSAKSLPPVAREQRVQTSDDNFATKLEANLNRAQWDLAHENDIPTYGFLPLDGEGALSYRPQLKTCSDYAVGIAEHRNHGEDRSLCTTLSLTCAGTTYPVSVFGVFDGHGGSEVAQYCHDHLPSIILDMLSTHNTHGLSSDGIWTALKAAFVEMNKRITHAECGSTAVVCLIINGQLWTANIGDSRAVLYRDKEVIALSEDSLVHKPHFCKTHLSRNGFASLTSIPTFYEREGQLFQRPEIFSRINRNCIPGRGLAMSRAFGDRSFPGISARPKLTAIDASDSFLVIGSDGVFATTSRQQIGEIIRKESSRMPLDLLAASLVHSSRMAGSNDDLTLMVVST